MMEEGAEEEDLAEDIERVRELLASAPADRAWRCRGYLVLCRAHPYRMQHNQVINGTRHPDTGLAAVRSKQGQGGWLGGSIVHMGVPVATGRLWWPRWWDCVRRAFPGRSWSTFEVGFNHHGGIQAWPLQEYPLLLVFTRGTWRADNGSVKEQRTYAESPA